MKLLSVTCLLLCLLGALPIDAATWYVNCASGSDSNSCASTALSCKTIQRGINVASTTDTVRVYNGPCTENNLSFGKKLTLAGGSSSPVLTTVDCSATAHRCLSLTNAADSGSTIDNIDFTGGSALSDTPTTGGAIYATQAFVMTNSQLRNSKATSGGGLYVGAVTVSLTNTPVTGNTATTLSGGGIEIASGGRVDIDSTVSNNKANTNGGGISTAGILNALATAVFSGNTANGAASTYNGGGIYFSAGTMTIAGGASFTSNSAGSGGAIFATPSLTLSGVFVKSNLAANYGAGVYATAASTISGSVFSLNTATSNNGGGVYFGAASSLSTSYFSNNKGLAGGGAFFNLGATIADTAFNANSAGASGGAGAFLTGAATISNANFTLNSASGPGGGANAGNTLSLSGSIYISGNTATNGGGMYLSSAASLTNAIVVSNVATTNGAGLYLNAGGTITGSTFTSNSAAGLGGGWYTSTSGVSLSTSLFSLNTAGTAGGGGGYQAASVTVTIANTPFLSNSGGGLYCAAGVSITNANFTSNSGSGNGGGVYSGAGITISGTAFFGSNSGSTGGGYYATSASTITGATFIGNTASSSGAGAALNGGGSISGTAFTSNTAATNGGGLFTGAATTVATSLFLLNKAAGGGGAYLTGAGTVSDTPFVTNTGGATGGGGLYGSSTLTVTNANFTANSGSGNGGGILGSSSITLSGTAFFGSNTGSIGGGYYATSASTITGATFVSNFASNSGGGAALIAGGSVSGTVFTSNTATNNAGGLLGSGAVTLNSATFVLNKAAAGGGAQLAASSTVADSPFISNSATGSSGGGGLFAAGVTFSNANFTGNTAAGPGGGACLGTGSIAGSGTIYFGFNSGTLGGGLYFSSTGTITGGTFISNTATTSGGGIYLVGASTVVGVTVTGNTATGAAPAGGGGLFSVGALTLQTTASTFSGNSATGCGGGMNVAAVTQSITVTVRTNSATNGGGVCTTGAAVFVGTSQIVENRATLGGGAYAMSATGASFGGNVSSNVATTGGGAYFAIGAGIANAATFLRNSATDGGGLYVNSGAATLGSATFSYNVATTGSGGAVYCAATSVTLTSTSLDHNTAVTGGAVYSVCAGSSMTTVTATSNSATSGGAVAIATASAVMTVSGGTYTLNSASGNGGGLIATNGQLTLASTATFTQNSAVGDGGGVYITAGTLAGTSFISNSNSAVNGGGLYIGSSAIITPMTATLSLNTASASGGGMYSASTSTVTAVLTVTSNSAQTGGGVALAGASGTLSLGTGSGVSSNTASTNGGGVYMSSGAALTLTNNAAVSSNSATQNGGGIYDVGTGAVTVSGGTAAVNSNQAGLNGGGIYGAGSGAISLSGTSATVSSNTAAQNGGGIYEASTGTVTVSGTTAVVSTNKATAGSGGAVYLAGGSLTISGGTMGSSGAANTAAVSGGAIYTGSGTTTSITGGTISFNSAPSGGAASIGGSTATIGGGAFTSNTASGAGGAVNLVAGSLTISGSPTFTSNSAGGSGGAINEAAGTISISGGTFTLNTASASGGGLSISAGSATISGGTFGPNNKATTSGGAVYEASGASLSLTGGTFSSSTAATGGGMYAAGTLLSTGSPAFTSNVATTSGGGLYYTGTGTANFATPAFTSNSAPLGGGLYDNGPMTIGGASFTTNSAGTSGGGVYDAGSLTVTGATFRGNTASTSGGGVFNTGPLTVSSSAILQNSAPTGAGLYVSGTTLSVTGSMISLNSASTSGGGITALNAGPVITSTNVSKNTAPSGSGYDCQGYGTFFVTTPTIICENSGPLERSSSFCEVVYNSGTAQVPYINQCLGTCTGYCGNNGVCDYSTGVCKCNTGFSGLTCNVTLPATVITAINPYFLNTSGGDYVTLTGTGFTTTYPLGQYSLSFGTGPTSPCTFVSVLSTTQLVCLTTAAPNRWVQLSLTDPYGVTVAAAQMQCINQCTGGQCSGFSHNCAVKFGPTITQVTPQRGYTTGSAGVTLNGYGFSSNFASNNVTADGQVVTITAATTTQLVVTMPPHVAAVVSFSGVLFRLFPFTCEVCSYEYADSQITSINPPISLHRFTPTNITIQGFGFLTILNGSHPPVITISGSPCTVWNFTLTATSLVCLDTPHLVGNVVLTMKVGSQISNSVCNFALCNMQYYAQITGFNVLKGSANGGTQLQIVGVGFTPYAQTDNVITVGGVPCTITGLTDTTTITCTTGATASSNVLGWLPIVVVVNLVTSVCTAPNCNFLYSPEIVSITPDFGPVAGGDPLTITGYGFSAGTRVVSIDGAVATCGAPSGCSPLCTLVCTTGGHTNALDVLVNITVTVSGLQYPAVWNSDTLVQYDYVSQITLINPTSGTANGGTLVTISGSGFSTTLTSNVFYFGSTLCDVQSATTTQVVCRTRTITGGIAALVTVTHNVNLVPGLCKSPPCQFSYQPEITSILPPTGPTCIGNTITVQGYGFSTTLASNAVSSPSGITLVSSSTTTLIFTTSSSNAMQTGGTAITLTVNSQTQICSVTPTCVFRFVPQITSFSPVQSTSKGGVVVTVNGCGFASATGTNAMSLAGVNCAALNPGSPVDQQLLCTTAASAPVFAGTVAATRTVGGEVFNVLCNAASCNFKYLPDITNVNPSTGPVEGGTSVVVTGYGFDAAMANDVLLFGTAACTVTAASTTSLTCTTTPLGGVLPALSSARVTVSLTTLNLFSAICTSCNYDYQATVTAVTPFPAPIPSGTVVLTGTGFSATAASNVVTLASYACTVTAVSSTTLTCTYTGVTVPVNAGAITLTVGSSPAISGKICAACTITFAPVITSILPASGASGRGVTVLTVAGFGFVSGSTTFTLGGVTCASPAVTGTPPATTTLTCTAGSKATAGPATIAMVSSTVSAICSPTTLCTYAYVPDVNSITPTIGVLAGGTTITFGGGGFGLVAANLAVAWGGIPCTVTGTPSGTGFTCTTGANTSPVAVATTLTLYIGGMTSYAVLCSTTCTYNYQASITAINPTSTPRSSLITISGIGFSGTVASNTVTVGAVSCSVTSSASTFIICTIGSSLALGPASAAVTVGGIISFCASCSVTVVPSVSSISLASSTSLGSVTISIGGIGFSATAAQNTVVFDSSGTPATCSVTAATTTQLTCTTAAHMSGVVSVTVTTSSYTATCTISGGSGCVHTYTPAINSVSTSSGSALGGAVITVGGYGFSTTCSLNTLSVGGVNCPITGTCTINSLQCTVAASPNSAAQVAAVAGVTGGLTMISTSTYTYVASITSITPTSGGYRGSTSLQLFGYGFSTTLVSNVISVGGTACTVNSASATVIVCSTPAVTTITGTAVSVTGTVSSISITCGGTCNYLYVPEIDSVSPSSGTANGGTPITVTGVGLGGTTSVVLDAAGTTATCTGMTSTATSATCTTSAHVPGDISVTANHGAAVSVCNTCAFQYRPQLTAIAPLIGRTSGSSITISGYGFDATTMTNNIVTINGVACNVTSSTTTTVVCNAGANPAGTYSVQLTRGFGPSYVAICTTCAYTYAPVITSITPTTGAVTGGDTITVGGEGFSPGVLAVTIGGLLCNVTGTVAAGSFACVIPPLAAGAVTVNLTVSSVAAFCQSCLFTFAASVTAVNPTQGTIRGGTVITVTGFGFVAGSTTAQVNGINCAAIGAVTTNSFTCTAPVAANRGDIFLTVAIAGQTAVCVGSGCAFRYLPDVTGVLPGAGNVTGGNVITLQGFGFSTTPTEHTISFNGVTCTAVASTATTVACVVAQGSYLSDTYSVQMSIIGGFTALCTSCSYSPAAVITGVTPLFGGISGNTTITVQGIGFSATFAQNVIVVGGSPCTVFGPASSSAVTCVTTAHAWGNTSVADTTKTIPAVCLSSDACRYAYVHEVNSVSPVRGSLGGNTPITITGTNFSPVTGETSVQIGGAPCTITFINTTMIQCTTTSNNLGAYDTTVYVRAVPSACLSCTFAYVGPQLESISPLFGTVRGGINITLYGKRFSEVPTDNVVTINGAGNCIVFASTNTTINCTTPAYVVAVVDISLVVQDIPAVCPDPTTCRYQYRPEILSIDAPYGSLNGGTSITVNGAGFSTVNANNLVDISGASCTVLPPAGSSVSLRCATGPHAKGSTLVSVSVSGVPAVCTNCSYEYVAEVGTISPRFGSLLGGTTISIAGVNFGSVSGVTVGGVICPLVGTPTATQIVCTTPAGAALGSAAVQVRLSDQIYPAACGANCTFLYVGVINATLTAHTPYVSVNGSSLVTIRGYGLPSTIAQMAIQLGAASCAPLTSSFTQITCTADAYSVKGAATVSVRVGTQAMDSPVPISVTYAPVILRIRPTTGSISGGTRLTVGGDGFSLNSTQNTLKIGGISCTPDPAEVSTYGIVCVTPAQTYGQRLVMANANGFDAICLIPSCNFTYVSEILTISPSTGPLTGGQTITISGTGFSTTPADNQVLIGSSPCTITSVTATTIVCTTGPGTSGIFSVSVTVNNVTSVGGTNSFTITGSQVTRISPTSGSVRGGTVITISGLQFAALPSSNVVTMGGVSCVASLANATMIICATPPGSRGTTAVVVAISGLNALCLGTTCNFQYFPDILGISPGAGTLVGGTLVSVTGQGFSSTTINDNVVLIDGVPCTPTGAPSSTVITCVTGPHPVLGVVHATVNVLSGTFALCTVCNFTYSPEVKTITPRAGIDFGGTMVTIVGNGFAAGLTTIGFNAKACGNLTVLNSTALTCVMPQNPAGSYPIQLAVSGVQRVCAVAADCMYNYVAVDIQSVSPDNGPVTGGTRITLTGHGFGLFASNNSVTVNDVPCAVDDVGLTATTLSCVTGRATVGVGIVRVVATGIEGLCVVCGYTYRPLITAVTESAGSTKGYQPVVINGFGFSSLPQLMAVTIGGQLCTVTASTNTSVTCITAPLAAGNVPNSVTPPLHVRDLPTINPDQLVGAYTVRVTVKATERDVVGQEALCENCMYRYVVTECQKETNCSTCLANPWCAWCDTTLDCRDLNATAPVCGTIFTAQCLPWRGPPVITTIKPAVSPLAGGVAATHTGSNLQRNLSVVIGGTKLQDEVALNSVLLVDGHDGITINSDNTVMVVALPAVPAQGYYALDVTNWDLGELHVDEAYFYTDICPYEGMWGDASGTCVQCPFVGGTCPGGPRVRAEPGYWNSGEFSGFIEPCDPALRCAGGREALCAVGYSGAMCSACSAGYYREGELCLECTTGTMSGLEWTIMIFAAAFFYGVFVIPSYVCHDNILDSVAMGLQTMQLLRAALQMVSYTLPVTFQKFSGFLAALSMEIDVLRPACFNGLETTYAWRFWLALLYLSFFLLPILLMPAFGFLRSMVVKDFEQKKETRHWYMDRTVRALLLFLSLNYVNLTTLAWEALYCHKTSDGVVRLVWEPAVECFVGDHMHVAIAAAVIIVGYVIAFPVGVTIFLVRVIRPVCQDGDRRSDLHERLLRKTGVLFEPFKHKHYSFVLVYFVMEFLMVGIYVMLQGQRTYQFFAAFIGYFLCMLFIIRKFPFYDPYENYMLTFAVAVAQFIVLVNYVGSLPSLQQQIGDPQALIEALSVLTMLLVGALILFFIITLIVGIYRNYVIRKMLSSKVSKDVMKHVHAGVVDKDYIKQRAGEDLTEEELEDVARSGAVFDPDYVAPTARDKEKVMFKKCPKCGAMGDGAFCAVCGTSHDSRMAFLNDEGAMAYTNNTRATEGGLRRGLHEQGMVVEKAPSPRGAAVPTAFTHMEKCPKCGVMNSSVFCTKCGTAISGSKPLTRPGSTESSSGHHSSGHTKSSTGGAADMVAMKPLGGHNFAKSDMFEEDELDVEPVSRPPPGRKPAPSAIAPNMPGGAVRNAATDPLPSRNALRQNPLHDAQDLQSESSSDQDMGEFFE